MNQPFVSRRIKMPEWFVFVLILAGWIVLQAWILPRFGVQT